MGRPSVRKERRTELTIAFARVLSRHGYAGATIARIAAEAGVAPGLVHHHFRGKEDLLLSLVDMLITRFRERVRDRAREDSPLDAYVSAAIGLDGGADPAMARCWVSVFAEALRDASLFARVRRLVDSELGVIAERSRGGLSPHESAAILAFVFGALVLGAFAPRKTAGFAEPAARALVRALGAAPRR
jgi:TetR/AcrR family transcriptional regulator, transcriptional repressor of bet genes